MLLEKEELLHKKIALSMIPNIGPRLVRRMVAYAGDVEAVFKEKKKWLAKVPGIGEIKASYFDTDTALRRAEEELENLTRKDINAVFYLDENYPLRLKECEDAPVILYTKGRVNFNPQYALSVVGTRKATEYGRQITEEILEYLAGRYPDMLVVSGLAYGIDIISHRAALKNNLPTVAALGHGLDFLYPSVHRSEAEKIKENGALVTEFPSGRKADPGNFISRNRIIAGMSDATIVVESAKKGGALITADLAASYHRDVFAVPGKCTDVYSQGCNALIKSNKAALIEKGADVEAAMRWIPENDPSRKKSVQRALFVDLSPEESSILDFLGKSNNAVLDEICYSLEMPIHKVSSGLLNLEFNGLVRSLPGKVYQKI